jgi:putative redox protein
MDLLTIEQVEDQEFEIQVRGHRVASDMALDDDGHDLGPSPTELLVGSLGACIGMVIARYCKAIDCSTEGLALYLTYQLAEKPKRVQSIVIDLELPKGFPDERKPAIQRLIRMCPVHGTLTEPPEIDIEIE